MHWVFDQTVSFNEKALKLFKLQAEKCQVYKQYLSLLKINSVDINSIQKIPFLPIEFFKTKRIISEGKSPEITFSSSGTTGQDVSQHHIADVSIYEKSYTLGFEHFYDKPTEYRILALLPTYLEREGSSLVYMCHRLIQES